MSRFSACAAALLAGALLAVSAAGCGTSAADGRAAAARARQQVGPAARALHQRLLAAQASASSSGVGTYVPCGHSSTQLHYSVSLDLFPRHRGEKFAVYQRQVVAAVSAAGWKLRRMPRPALTDPGTLFYKMAKPAGSVVLVGALGLLPSPSVRGSAVVNSACFDAGPAAGSLLKQVNPSPLASSS